MSLSSFSIGSAIQSATNPKNVLKLQNDQIGGTRVQ